MKRPSFQFYPQDWLTDTGLLRCSLSAQGLWMKLLCLMNAGEPYGHLSFGGEPVQDEEIPGLVSCPDIDLTNSLRELTLTNTLSRNGDGTIYSRRMVRDETKRRKDKKYQRKHRDREKNVRGLSGKSQGLVRGLSGRSSSSSSLTLDPPDPSLPGIPSLRSSSSDDPIKDTPGGGKSWLSLGVSWKAYCRGVSWDKELTEVVLTSEAGEGLGEHLAAVAKSEGLAMLSPKRLKEGWGRLNTHLGVEGRKTGKKTLPGFVRGWLVTDLRRWGRPGGRKSEVRADAAVGSERTEMGEIAVAIAACELAHGPHELENLVDGSKTRYCKRSCGWFEVKHGKAAPEEADSGPVADSEENSGFTQDPAVD